MSGKEILQFASHVDGWIESLSTAGRSFNTVDCYRRDLRAFHAALVRLVQKPVHILDMKYVGQDLIDQIEARWRMEGASGQTIARRFSALRGFAAHLCVSSEVDCCRILAAKFPTAMSGRVLPAEPKDLRAVSSVGPDSNWIHLRNSAAFLTMACGMTTGETTGLDNSDVDIDRGIATVRHTCLRQRPVALSIAARDAIAAYRNVLPRTPRPDQPLFQTTRGTRLSARSLQVAFRMRRRILGMSDEIVLSSLRHAAGRECAERWRSPAAVGRLLGIDAANMRRYFEMSLGKMFLSNKKTNFASRSSRRTNRRSL
jgi:integrase/recombinase XerC